jgi:hypothetical protein
MSTSWKILPKKALMAISKRQRSYIDEFEFKKLKDGTIKAYYDKRCVGVWDGSRWDMM